MPSLSPAFANVFDIKHLPLNRDEITSGLEVDVMGFSLESMIAIPCCLTILAQTTGLALPLANHAKRAACVNTFMSTIGNKSGYTCRYGTITRETYEVPYVQTCPQKIVESLSLARDLYTITKIAINHDSGSGS